ncbi:hypothetical protein CARUB_v10025600mg [Capsella rubella]|uniref:Helicase/UvrB N-terminal domain-containing protein n=1 Tax=Capsella rubella TaxID=81985 RepID=R0HHZ4_9BRAS|nr:hypothetical protein CARUB_v10025600mg [Capsella rubella]
MKYDGKVEIVKQICIPNALNYPMLEEYDFKNENNLDSAGRARSEIVVLSCGAGKSLVGVYAAARIKKSCLFFGEEELSMGLPIQVVVYYKR